ncbi:MAG: hypothetical protein HYT08_03820 [Candidatus Levybacteria bacterium]|nr:hypothetical protein [Candidatus Levybacteria bacterium]
MKKLILLIILILGFIIGAGLILQQNNKNNPSTEIITPIQEQPRSFEPIEDNQGEVVVKVTPKRLSSKENVEFNISLSTHSVDLDYSLKDISLIEDDKGNEYKPISWSGGKGGHHLEGILIFPPFLNKTMFVRLIIKQIGGVDKNYKWDL